VSSPAFSAPPRRNRWNSVLAGGSAFAAARALASVCGLLTVPVALRVLGTEGFGIWAALQAIAAFVPMLDLGTGYRLQNELAHGAAHGRLAEVRRSVRTVLWLTCGASLLAGIAAIALGAAGGVWLVALGVESEESRAILDPNLGVLVALACAASPAAIGIRLAAGLQRFWLIGAAQAAASVLTLALTIIGFAVNIDAVPYLAGLVATPIAVNVVLTILLLRRLPAGIGWLRPPTPGELRASIRAGLPFFAPQIAGSLRFSAPPLILASLLGASAVTPYSLVQRLLGLIALPQSWLLEPLWPAYADAASRSDYGWIRKTLRISLAATLAATVLPLATAPFWAAPFIEWWTGYSASALSGGLIFWFVLWHVGLTLTNTFNYCLNGLGRMHWQAIYTPVSVVAGLGGMALIAPVHGLDVAIAPAALIMCVMNLPCAMLDVRQAMQRWPQRLERSPRVQETLVP
jgi:O-antigen/teichoic acid export membrane protein